VRLSFLFLLACFPERSSGFCLLDLANEGVEVGPFAGAEFGVERFAIGADFEGAAARWDEGKRRDAIAQIENLSRQTDGFRRVVSNRAILDPDFGFHRTLLSGAKLSARERWVKLGTLGADRYGDETLLCAQGDHRVDAGGAARGNKAGCGRDRSEERGYRAVDERIERVHLEKNVL